MFDIPYLIPIPALCFDAALSVGLFSIMRNIALFSVAHGGIKVFVKLPLFHYSREDFAGVGNFAHWPLVDLFRTSEMTLRLFHRKLYRWSFPLMSWALPGRKHRKIVNLLCCHLFLGESPGAKPRHKQSVGQPQEITQKGLVMQRGSDRNL